MKTLIPTAKLAFHSHRLTYAYAGNYIDQPYDLPDADGPREDSEDFDDTPEPEHLPIMALWSGVFSYGCRTRHRARR